MYWRANEITIVFNTIEKPTGERACIETTKPAGEGRRLRKLYGNENENGAFGRVRGRDNCIKTRIDRMPTERVVKNAFRTTLKLIENV